MNKTKQKAASVLFLRVIAGLLCAGRGPPILASAESFHIGGRETLSYQQLRGPSIFAAAGPFHIGGREALTY